MCQHDWIQDLWCIRFSMSRFDILANHKCQECKKQHHVTQSLPLQHQKQGQNTDYREYQEQNMMG